MDDDGREGPAPGGPRYEAYRAVMAERFPLDAIEREFFDSLDVIRLRNRGDDLVALRALRRETERRVRETAA